jgi:hypothetical protein
MRDRADATFGGEPTGATGRDRSRARTRSQKRSPLARAGEQRCVEGPDPGLRSSASSLAASITPLQLNRLQRGSGNPYRRRG